MKKIFVLLFCLVSGTAWSASLSVTKNMNFGTLTPTATSGTIVLSTASVLNLNGVATIVTTSGSNSATAATVSYAGEKSLSAITVTTPIVTLSNGSGGTMTVQTFVVSTPSTTTTSGESKSTVTIGASLLFTAASTAGTYTGTATVQSVDTSGNTQTETISISAVLWKTISATQTTPLSFGTISTVGTGPAVVQIAPATGARTVTSGASNITLVSSAPGSAGTFSITGQSGQNVTITLPSSITLSGPGTAMTVNAFTMSPSSNVKFNSSGSLTLKIGASLNIGASQQAGTYSGTYTVGINY